MIAVKPGDIGFLTRRVNKKPRYRWFISNSIAKLTKFKGQSIDEAKVHAFIIYEMGTELFVRDMDMKGSILIPLDTYLKRYEGRLEIVSMPQSANQAALNNFNDRCFEEKVKYDYANTFLWQVIREISRKWVGTNTPYKRMCSEDAQRMYNIINPIFTDVEKTNPNELHKFIKEYIK